MITLNLIFFILFILFLLLRSILLNLKKTLFLTPIQNFEFEVKDGATKGQIKTAFVKSLKTKKLNKKVLGEFVSLVA